MIELKEIHESYDWEQAFSVAVVRSSTPWLKTLSLSHPTNADVVEVIHAINGENDGPSWDGIFKLADGRYVSVSSSCDYTGWDCQAGGEIMVAASREEILRYGLSNSERLSMGIKLPEEDPHG